ncbi:MAG: hypothetical protein ACPHLK_07820 [Gammaproteobacteria bacterium]|jgi:hypothetical protein
MKVAIKIVVLLSFFFNINIFAEENKKQEAPMTAGGGTPLAEDEVKVGRYGETDETPDDFQFNEAEIKLWLTNHLENIKKPQSLYYEFNKTGSLEEGFSDSVYLRILELNEDGSKNTSLDFFTADRKQPVSPDNVTNIIGNPVLGIFMHGDTSDMARLTGGKRSRSKYFIKAIKVALREIAVVEPITFNFNDKEYQGEKVYFSPYLNDPHRPKFEKYAEKYYEFIFSDDIPGSLYQIKTVIPDMSGEKREPLIQETLTFVDMK